MSLDVGGFCEVEGAAVGGRVPVRDIGGLRSIYIASRIVNKRFHVISPLSFTCHFDLALLLYCSRNWKMRLLSLVKATPQRNAGSLTCRLRELT